MDFGSRTGGEGRYHQLGRLHLLGRERRVKVAMGRDLAGMVAAEQSGRFARNGVIPIGTVFASGAVHVALMAGPENAIEPFPRRDLIGPSGRLRRRLAVVQCPKEYGPAKTLYHCWTSWSDNGVSARIMMGLAAGSAEN